MNDKIDEIRRIVESWNGDFSQMNIKTESTEEAMKYSLVMMNTQTVEVAKILLSELDRLNELIAEERREGSKICLEWSETVDRLTEENVTLILELDKARNHIGDLIVLADYDADCIRSYGNDLKTTQQDKERLLELLKQVHIGAKHESCKYQDDDPDPTWHCCDWTEIAEEIEKWVNL